MAASTASSMLGTITSAVRSASDDFGAHITWLAGDRQRRGSPAERRTERAMGAPVAEFARAWPPVAGQNRTLDGAPQRLDLPLSGEQVSFVWRIPHDLAVAQVHQLQQPRHRALRPPQDQRVKPHLEQGPGLEVG